MWSCTQHNVPLLLHGYIMYCQVFHAALLSLVWSNMNATAKKLWKFLLFSIHTQLHQEYHQKGMKGLSALVHIKFLLSSSGNFSSSSTLHINHDFPLLNIDIPSLSLVIKQRHCCYFLSLLFSVMSYFTHEMLFPQPLIIRSKFPL